jgi:hypothetical protein
MKSYLLPAVIIFSTLLLAKCDCQHLCSQPVTELNFVKFDSLDLSVVIIRRFAKDDKFDNLLDTFVCSNAPGAGKDTTVIASDKLLVAATFDYKIFVPSLNRTWALTRISIHRDGSGHTHTCTSGLNYFINDSGVYVAPDFTADSMPALISIVK